jgi:hypothetical protein
MKKAWSIQAKRNPSRVTKELDRKDLRKAKTQVLPGALLGGLFGHISAARRREPAFDCE